MLSLSLGSVTGGNSGHERLLQARADAPRKWHFCVPGHICTPDPRAGCRSAQPPTHQPTARSQPEPAGTHADTPAYTHDPHRKVGILTSTCAHQAVLISEVIAHFDGDGKSAMQMLSVLLDILAMHGVEVHNRRLNPSSRVAAVLAFEAGVTGQQPSQFRHMALDLDLYRALSSQAQPQLQSTTEDADEWWMVAPSDPPPSQTSSIDQSVTSPALLAVPLIIPEQQQE